jgi:hypothetical protein
VDEDLVLPLGAADVDVPDGCSVLARLAREADASRLRSNQVRLFALNPLLLLLLSVRPQL